MDFYYTDKSPFCRSIMLTSRAIGVKLNKIFLDLAAGEHMKPEFLAINPQHTVPTLIDGDLTLWESRAICTYLVSQYAKDDSLYPKDPKKRVLIDKLLYFDNGVLSARMLDYFIPVLQNKAPPDPKKKPLISEALEWLNGFLEGNDFCVGNSLTVADMVLVASVTSIIEAELVDVSPYSNVLSWVKNCKATMVGYESENGEGVKKLAEYINSKFAEHQ